MVSKRLFLYIEMPQFDFPLIYNEKVLSSETLLFFPMRILERTILFTDLIFMTIYLYLCGSGIIAIFLSLYPF